MRAGGAERSTRAGGSCRICANPIAELAGEDPTRELPTPRRMSVDDDRKVLARSERAAGHAVRPASDAVTTMAGT